MSITCRKRVSPQAVGSQDRDLVAALCRLDAPVKGGYYAAYEYGRYRIRPLFAGSVLFPVQEAGDKESQLLPANLLQGPVMPPGRAPVSSEHQTSNWAYCRNALVYRHRQCNKPAVSWPNDFHAGSTRPT